MNKEIRNTVAAVLVLGGSLAGVSCGKELRVVDSAPATPTAAAGTPATPVGRDRLTVVTATLEAISANIMELPKPAAWDKAPVVSLVKASNVPSWPKTAAEAAATFGVDGSTRNPKRWEKTAEGNGWHLSEATIVDDTKDALNVNAKGYLTEGYYDTKPGRNPFAFVVVGIDGNIPAQGATFWNEKKIDQADKLQKEMAVPKWKDDNGRVTVHPVTKIVPN